MNCQTTQAPKFNNYLVVCHFDGKQGLLTSHQVWPIFDSSLVSHVFLVSCSLVTQVFLPPQKPTYPNSKSTRIEDPYENQLRLMQG